MNKFNDFEEYKQWASRAKENPGVVTNCFFLPTKVKDLISKGCLYGMTVSNGSILLEKAEGFYRCYYFLSPEMKAEKLSFDMPAVVEFVYNQNLTPEQEKQVGLLERMGFSLGRRSSKMTLAAENVLPEPVNLKIRPAVYSDVEVCKNLFREHFNPLFSFLPDESQWEKALEEETVFCLYQGEVLQGALFSDINKNVAELRILCVNPDCRGQGIGKMLVSAFHQKYKDRVIQFAHWVDVDNKSAVALYEKVGYNFDRRKANEYVL